MKSRRIRALALQGLASAITALLLGGAALAFGAPSDPSQTTAGATEPGDAPTDLPTETPTGDPTEPAEEITELAPPPNEDVHVDEVDERGRGKQDADRAAGNGKGQGKGKGKGNGKGNGKAVSEAARGVTGPVGDCRNHGHWVSTVARGGSSCDEFPRTDGDD